MKHLDESLSRTARDYENLQREPTFSFEFHPQNQHQMRNTSLDRPKLHVLAFNFFHYMNRNIKIGNKIGIQRDKMSDSE